jgi:hypothetical protein
MAYFRLAYFRLAYFRLAYFRLAHIRLAWFHFRFHLPYFLPNWDLGSKLGPFIKLVFSNELDFGHCFC